MVNKNRKKYSENKHKNYKTVFSNKIFYKINQKKFWFGYGEG